MSPAAPRLAAALLLGLCGCASFRYQDPATGQKIEAKLGVKGCVSLHRAADGAVDVQVEHDGMSSALAGTIRAVASAAGSVFGGEREDAGPPQAGEGCAPPSSASAPEPLARRRVLGELVEPPSPREVLR